MATPTSQNSTVPVWWAPLCADVSFASCAWCLKLKIPLQDYIAPEVLLAHQAALMTVHRAEEPAASDLPNQSVDWWALAVVAYEVDLVSFFLLRRLQG